MTRMSRRAVTSRTDYLYLRIPIDDLVLRCSESVEQDASVFGFLPKSRKMLRLEECSGVTIMTLREVSL